MVNLQYHFRCYDLGDCDIAIYSEYRESMVEAVQSHFRDAHGEELSEAEVAPLIETFDGPPG